jgi:hypothetical protein
MSNVFFSVGYISHLAACAIPVDFIVRFSLLLIIVHFQSIQLLSQRLIYKSNIIYIHHSSS